MKKKTIVSAVISVVLLAAALFLVLRSFGMVPPGGAAGPAGGAPGSGAGSTDGGPDSPSASSDAANPEGTRAEAAPVSVARSVRGDLAGDIRLNGEIEAANRVTVFPEVAGTVNRIEAVEGRTVRLDEPLLYVDPSRPGADFQESPVRSPIAGTVVSIDVERGEEVRPTAAVATVATLAEVRVSVEVPERYVSVVEPGMSATFTSFAVDDGEYPGEVVSVEPTIDPDSRSKLVKLRIDGRTGELEPGMFVRVSLPLARATDAVTIPFRALVQEGGDEYIYTVDDGAARRVSVRTGIIADGRVEIRDGIEANQTVVVEGHRRLRPGRPVSIVEGNNGEGTSE